MPPWLNYPHREYLSSEQEELLEMVPTSLDNAKRKGYWARKGYPKFKAWDEEDAYDHGLTMEFIDPKSQ
ncbi:hypothetical protein CR513_02373, partial [Mucuna pruriens]